MKYPLVRELAVEGFPVTVTCRVLKFSTQGYYKWLACPVTARDLANAYLTNAAIDAHRDDPAFGYRFLSDELEAQGHVASERRVWRLCSEQRIWSSFVKKSRSGKRPGPPGPRRPGPSGLLGDVAQSAVVHRHHRASHVRGQALPVQPDGRTLHALGGLLDRRSHDGGPGDLGAAQRHRAAPARGDRGPQRQRVAISITEIRLDAGQQRPDRLDGPGRVGRRQRRHRVIPLPAAEQRPQQSTLGDEGGPAPRDRHLDREEIPPSASQAPPGSNDAGRVRGAKRRSERGMKLQTKTVN